MEVLKYDYDSIGDCVDSLNNGGVILLPTDTSYGFSALLSDTVAINKIYDIKHRDRNKPMLVLVSDIAMLRSFADLSVGVEENLLKVMAEERFRAISFLLKYKKEDFKSDFIFRGYDKLVFRIPKNDFLVRLISSLGQPIVSTSANISGNDPIYSFTEIYEQFKENELIDLAINKGKLNEVPVSKIVEILDLGEIKILRD